MRRSFCVLTLAAFILLQPLTARAFSPIWNVNGWSKDRLAQAGLVVRPWKHQLASEDPPLQWVEVTFDCASIPKDQQVLMTAWFRTGRGTALSATRVERKEWADGKMSLVFCIDPGQAESSSVVVEIWSKTPDGHEASGYELSLKRVGELAGEQTGTPAAKAK